MPQPSTRLSLLACAVLFPAAAFATPITLTSSAIPTTTLAPSNDTFTLNAGSATLSAPGTVIFQTGTFYLGNSPIADQIIPFSFTETVTLNGTTKTITVTGQDNVTSSADVLTFFSSPTTNFGNYNFTLNSSSYNGTVIGQSLPVQLSATVSVVPTPEPASLALLGTGLLGGLAATLRHRRAI